MQGDQGKVRVLFVVPMDLKLLSWNVRGMENKEKKVILNQNLMGSIPDILCLQETKIQVMSDRVVKEVWGSRPCD